MQHREVNNSTALNVCSRTIYLKCRGREGVTGEALVEVEVSNSTAAKCMLQDNLFEERGSQVSLWHNKTRTSNRSCRQ